MRLSEVCQNYRRTLQLGIKLDSMLFTLLGIDWLARQDS